MSMRGERVDSASGMRMLHLMINRRQVPDKKTSLVNESLNDGLATFALDGQESDYRNPQQVHKHPPRRSYKYPKPDSSSSPRNDDDEIVPHFDHYFKEGKSSSKGANGDRDDGSSNGGMNFKRRHRRAGSLDMKRLENIRLGPTLTTSMSFKENRLGDDVPEEPSSVEDSTGKFAYISLDGRLINAELATSVTSIGGGLGDEEAQAWEDFAPMERVLIVAVSAAAAAAAKHRNRKEIDLLLKTVESRENELVLLRQQLSELCKQSHTNASDIHSDSIQLLENLSVKSSPKTPAQRELYAMRRCSFDGVDTTKMKLDLLEAWSSSKPAHLCARAVESELRAGDDDERRLSRVSPVNKDVVLVESARTPCTGESLSSNSFPVGDEAWAKEEAKWYVNPMVETSQDFYDISTPERCNSMYSVCNPAVQGSFEWTYLRSTFANRETEFVSEPRLPVVASLLSSSPTQTTVSNSSTYQTRSQMENDEALYKQHKAMGTVCAAAVLDLRERMQAVLDKEAAMVMAALDTSLEDAKTQIAAMHLGVTSCWNASVAKALAALTLSPSELDSYILNDTHSSSIWRDISKIEESVVAWRQYQEKNYGSEVTKPGGGEGKSPTKRSIGGADESSTPSPFSCVSAQNQDRKIGSQSEGLGCAKNSAEELAEQLLGELDKAAAKVAVMERQMKKLEQDVAGCDGKQICKLAGCFERDLENQVKGREDVAELVRELQSKEVEVADLKRGQQTLLDSKNKEIEELKEEHKRRDAELDKELAAAEATKVASAARLAVLEELCKQKDSTLSYLKQDIQSLESKVHGSRVYRSPAVPRARRSSISSTPSSSSGYGNSQKQRFSQKYASSPPGSDPIVEHIGRFRRDAPSDNSVDRNIPYINTQRHEELTDDGRSEQGYDQETSHEYSSPPGSTIGDDCSINSLAFSETEVESRPASEYCSSGDDSRYRSSKDRLSETKSSSYIRTLQKQKSISSDLRRAVTSTARSVHGLTRVPGKSSTSATSVPKTSSGEKQLSKPLHRTLSGDLKKVIKDPNSPRTSNLKVLGSVAANTSVNHRRSSSLDMNYKSNICSILETSGVSGVSGGSLDGGSLDNQENSAIKRKRWV